MLQTYHNSFRGTDAVDFGQVNFSVSHENMPL
jgi:hypothetical protein